jgi:arylsulfatase
MDWWPTFASIIGQPVPTHEWKNNNGKPIIFDGIDLSASLLGTGPGKRDTMLYFAAQMFGAVRVRNFKAVFHCKRHLARPCEVVKGPSHL